MAHTKLDTIDIEGRGHLSNYTLEGLKNKMVAYKEMYGRGDDQRRVTVIGMLIKSKNGKFYILNNDNPGSKCNEIKYTSYKYCWVVSYNRDIRVHQYIEEL